MYNLQRGIIKTKIPRPFLLPVSQRPRPGTQTTHHALLPPPAPAALRLTSVTTVAMADSGVE